MQDETARTQRASPRRAAQRLVRELEGRGEVRARDVAGSVRSRVSRSVRARSELVQLVRKEVRSRMRSRRTGGGPGAESH
ncbi:MAG TPA: hypothetical protein VNE62_01425 [Actinomycetota bacterium]|nr:hypothetical protein [Actinomycetota bacterium]